MSGVRPSVRQHTFASSVFRDQSRRRFVVFTAMAALIALTGGSFNPQLPALAVLRPLLVLSIGLMVIMPGTWDWRGLRIPASILALFAATMVVQLVPLPPGWWAAMPGHDRYAGIVALMPDAWRPISLAPDLTVNSVLALLPAIAVIVAFAGMNDRDRWNILWVVLGVGIASVVVSLVQTAGGNGPSTLAAYSDQGVVTGLLANRNHGAVLLAILLPLTAVILRNRPLRQMTRLLALAATGAVVLPLILLSGSRQGLALGLAALCVAAAMLVSHRRPIRHMRLYVLAGVATLAVIVFAMMMSGRALTMDRLGGMIDPSNEVRLRSFPIVVQMTRDFLPWGIGYGAFDQVYRGYEPDAFLHGTYFNHAHNDLIETVMSGGLPVLLPLGAFLLWFGKQAKVALREPTGLGRAAIAIVLLIFLASLVDYPLRTSVMSFVFATACCWLGTRPSLPDVVSPKRRP